MKTRTITIEQIEIDGEWRDIDSLDGWDISKLLQKQPQFIDRFDLTKLKGWDISYLLQEQPQLKSKFDELKKEQ